MKPTYNLQEKEERWLSSNKGAGIMYVGQGKSEIQTSQVQLPSYLCPKSSGVTLFLSESSLWQKIFA